MTSPPRTSAEVLAEACALMVAVSGDTTKDITLFAAADAIDVMRSHTDERATLVARAIHDRMCSELTCGPTMREEHAGQWFLEAEAAVAWYEASERSTSSLGRAHDRRMCLCGHIRMGHSVAGDRCYATPCTCAVEGGFREAIYQNADGTWPPRSSDTRKPVTWI